MAAEYGIIKEEKSNKNTIAGRTARCRCKFR